MLLPRFSIRWMLAATAVCGLFFVVLASAVQGRPWAVAITIAVGGALLTFLIYAVFFAAAFVLSVPLGLRRQAPTVRSPFAQHVAAPQLVTPDEDD